MKTYCRSFLIATSCFFVLRAAVAALPNTEASRIVEVEKMAAPARQILFSMAYAVQPICARDRGDWNWHFGPLPTTIPIKRIDRVKWMQAQSDAIAAHFKMEPGNNIFLAEIAKTPWGYAGFKAEEPFDFNLKGQELIELLNVRRTPDAGLVAAKDEANKANPFVEVGVIRQGESVKHIVRRVPVCLMGLNAVDSKYRYADSRGYDVIATVPLLEKLTRDELVVVLSHEVAHIALKLSARSTEKLVAKLIFGRLIEMTQNQESELYEPKDTDLVQADRLAMRVAAGFGVDVPSYVSTIQKLVADQDSFGAPTYRRTRGISPNRAEQLQRSAALWNAEKKFYSVTALDPKALQDVTRRARLVNTLPERVFGSNAQVQASPNVEESGPSDVTQQDKPPSVSESAGVRMETPLPSGFAEIDDVNAIPYITDKGRESYRKWLATKGPRAFAISTAGASAAAFGSSSSVDSISSDPSERAVLRCNSVSREPCRVYAVNGAVIWVRQPTDPEKIAASVPVVHGLPVPLATQFAKLTDVAAVPGVGETGRALYQEWLTKPFPRAVAISDKGAIARGYGSKGMETAIKNCEKFNNPCRLYAVDDQVVWTKP